MKTYIKGVNLGGWLIIEKWITPSLFRDFNGEDEFSFMQNGGAHQRIVKHRQTFITESDFEWLSKNGINLVRIPVGYWLFESIDGFEPTVQYLDNAMKWATKHKIKVLIDLHGAPGSQNGKNHSGKQGEALWFKKSSYQQQTLDLLRQIAKRYHSSSALWGIELLNEPRVAWRYFDLLKFYRRSSRYIRR